MTHGAKKERDILSHRISNEYYYFSKLKNWLDLPSSQNWDFNLMKHAAGLSYWKHRIQQHKTSTEKNCGMNHN